jgi:hypothetical protein
VADADPAGDRAVAQRRFEIGELADRAPDRDRPRSKIATPAES